MTFAAVLLSTLLVQGAPSSGPTRLTSSPARPLGTLREQAAVQQEWLRYRLDSVLPRLMRQYQVAMWVVPMREYNEDPVFWSLVSATSFFARRRTIYVFFDRGRDRGVERLALGGASQGGLYEAYHARDAIDPSIGRRPELVGQAQWDLLRRVIEERDPQTIAVDISHTHAFSDGLSAGEWEQLQAALPERYRTRIVRAEALPLEYQEIRAPAMLSAYRRLMQVVWGTIDTAFSNKVVVPGRTTTEDVAWWMRQRVNDLGFGTWFHTDVDVQRRGVDLSDSGAVVIQRGDVLHCDFGITALGLNTDTQHMGYVLQPGERDVPEGLKQALGNSNRLQDILLAEMQPGRTGNEVLAAALAQMRAAGITGTIYTHPIGDRGHGAGPLIGLWDHQEGVPGRGDVSLKPNTWFSIELQATTPLPEWGNQPVRSAQEEDAELGADGQMRWILRRQTEFHVVKETGNGKMYDVETPALLLHLDAVERNVERMAARARQLRVALRPHAKTHKCVEVARLQLEHGARGLTVSTLIEAEVFARAGFGDLTWAFPIDPSHVPHARRIAEETGATLRVAVDDERTACALAGSGLHVWLKVDSGLHRAGVNPASPYALQVAAELGQERGLVFDGILTHSGHAYRTTNKAEAARVAEQERSVMVGFAERLREAGVPVREVSVGSTPAMTAAQDLTGVTEARPGNYVFHDRTMVLIGCCGPADVGVTVLATVVSHQPGAAHFIVDAGALELSKDPGPAHVAPQAMGAVRGAPELTVATLSQEHGLIRAESAAALDGRFPVGTQVEIIPNHSCLTVPLFDEYHVIRGTGDDAREADRWKVERGR